LKFPSIKGVLPELYREAIPNTLADPCFRDVAPGEARMAVTSGESEQRLEKFEVQQTRARQTIVVVCISSSISVRSFQPH